MRLIDEDEVVKFYKNMGKQFPELSVGTHFSIADIISNLDNIPTVKKEKIMTMTNAEWCIKQGYKFNDINVLYTKDNGVYAISIKKNGAYTCLGTIKKTCAIYAFMEWLDMEHKEPILDEAEKRYLSAVIEPFRERVNYICKIESRIRKETQFIKISTGDNYYDSIIFPLFSSGTMYRGMEANRDYTLEELGL